LFDSTNPTLQLSETPGLGFEADWDALSRYIISRHTVTG
jgi:hypothetical protein